MWSITRIKEGNSPKWGQFYWIFMRDLKKKKSCRTFVVKTFRNWALWVDVFMQWKRGKHILLDGLTYKANGLIDADSPVRQISRKPATRDYSFVCSSCGNKSPIILKMKTGSELCNKCFMEMMKGAENVKQSMETI